MATAPAAEPAAASVLAARDLVKRFGSRVALNGVSFEVHRGELMGVIGPNGAGKTTLLSILAGVQRPDAGEISRPRGEIGWIPQQAAIYRRLTVRENLRLFARLESLSDPDDAIALLLDEAGLVELADQEAGTLSGGNQQRLNIAIGLLSRPPVLLLDEPSAALDPRQRQRLWHFVSALAGAGTTVIFSTHNIQEAERYGSRLLVLADGEALFDGTPAGLRQTVVSETGDAVDFETAFVAFLRKHGH